MVKIEFDHYGTIVVTQYEGRKTLVLGRYSHLLNAVWAYPDAEVHII